MTPPPSPDVPVTDALTVEIVEQALVRIADNVARHIIQRDGWRADDACFEIDLRSSIAEIMALVEADRARYQERIVALAEALEGDSRAIHRNAHHQSTWEGCQELPCKDDRALLPLEEAKHFADHHSNLTGAASLFAGAGSALARLARLGKAEGRDG